jgi:hypothetical protein
MFAFLPLPTWRHLATTNLRLIPRT